MFALRTPEDRFRNLPGYPFSPHYADVGDGLRAHYVDEGPKDGTPIVMMHGEPSWSYLYRKMIPVFAEAGFRALAPDLIGFGKSDKPTDPDVFTYAKHVAWMTRWLESVDARNAVLVCQDWGSLIGLRVVAENQSRFARIVVANGFLPTARQGVPPAFRAWRAFSRYSPVFPIGRIVASGCVSKLAPDVIAAYDAPFPTRAHKAAARVFPSLVPTRESDPAVPANRAAWDVLGKWDKPFLTLFGKNDPILGKGDAPLQAHVPGAKGQPHERFWGGHFVQEDRGDYLAERIVAWMGAPSQSSSQSLQPLRGRIIVMKSLRLVSVPMFASLIAAGALAGCGGSDDTTGTTTPAGTGGSSAGKAGAAGKAGSAGTTGGAAGSATGGAAGKAGSSGSPAGGAAGKAGAGGAGGSTAGAAGKAGSGGSTGGAAGKAGAGGSTGGAAGKAGAAGSTAGAAGKSGGSGAGGAAGKAGAGGVGGVGGVAGTGGSTAGAAGTGATGGSAGIGGAAGAGGSAAGAAGAGGAVDPCTNGTKDGDETGVDCGGATCTAKCDTGGGCVGNADCVSTYCDLVSMTCAADHCSDQATDADETGVDCGGPTCATKCATGGGCAGGSDCASGYCDLVTLTCAADHCSDEMHDADESGNDCGGPTCATKCLNGDACVDGTDCASGICVVGMCYAVLPTSCKDLITSFSASAPSGTYSIDPDGVGANAPFDAYCDMVTDGGGWTLVGRSAPGGFNPGCGGGALGSTFGWHNSTGTLADDTVEYSLDVSTAGLSFDTTLFGSYTSGKTWDRAYKQPLPAGTSFVSTYATIEINQGMVTTVLGDCPDPNGMFNYVGFTNNVGIFHWRDVPGGGFGLTPSGWETCYAPTDPALGCYAGKINGAPGMVMVR